jgi:hypothetical protein
MSSEKSDESENWVQAQTSQKILEALQGIRFGAVEITIHDGRIVQIERKEKLRLNGDGRPG